MADESNTTESQSSTDTATADQTAATTTSADTSSTTANDDTTILGTKSEGEEAQGEKTEAAAEANPLLGAPEGDYTITGLPEGVTPDAEVVAALAPIAKEIGLSDVAMSKLALAYNDTILPHVTQTLVSGIEADVAAQRRDWANETRLLVEGGKDDNGAAIAPDKAFDGKDMKAVRAIAAKALDRFGGADLREFLETSGLGNNPALVRFAYQAGARIAEDSDVGRTTTSTSSAKPERPKGGLDTDSFYPAKS